MMGLHPDVRAAMKARKARLAAENDARAVCTAEPPPSITQTTSPPTLATLPESWEIPDDDPDDDPEDHFRIDFLPTPEEIAVACLEIQATWTEHERRLRARGLIGNNYESVGLSG